MSQSSKQTFLIIFYFCILFAPIHISLGATTDSGYISLNQQIRPEQKIEQEFSECGLKLHQQKVFCPNGRYSFKSKPTLNLSFPYAPTLSLNFQDDHHHYFLVSPLTPQGPGPVWIFQVKDSGEVKGQGQAVAFFEQAPSELKDLAEANLDKIKQAFAHEKARLLKGQAKGKLSLGLSEMLTVLTLREHWEVGELIRLKAKAKAQGALAQALYQEEILNQPSWQTEEQSLRALSSKNILTFMSAFWRLWQRNLAFSRQGRLATGLGPEGQSLDALMALAVHHRSETYAHILLALAPNLANSYRLSLLQESLTWSDLPEVSSLYLKNTLFGQDGLYRQGLALLSSRALQDEHAKSFLNWVEKGPAGFEARATSLLQLKNFQANSSSDMQKARLRLSNGLSSKVVEVAIAQLKENPPANELANYWERHLGADPRPEALSLAFIFPLKKQMEVIARYLSHAKSSIRESLLNGMLGENQESFRSFLLPLMFDESEKIRGKAVAAMMELHLTPQEYQQSWKTLQSLPSKQKTGHSLDRGETLLQALSEVETSDKIPLLTVFLRRGNATQKKLASTQMGTLDGRELRTLLINLLKDPSEDVRLNAHVVLSNRELTDENYQSLRSIVSIKDELGMDLVIDLLAKDANPSSRELIEHVAQKHSSAKIRKKAQEELLYQSL